MRQKIAWQLNLMTCYKNKSYKKVVKQVNIFEAIQIMQNIIYTHYNLRYIHAENMAVNLIFLKNLLSLKNVYTSSWRWFMFIFSNCPETFVKYL